MTEIGHDTIFLYHDRDPVVTPRTIKLRINQLIPTSNYCISPIFEQPPFLGII